MKFWVVSINSESGDDYGAFIFKDKPSDNVFERWLRDNFSDDADTNNGPGIFGTYLYCDWNEQEVINL